jgi:hypothetical protein
VALLAFTGSCGQEEPASVYVPLTPRQQLIRLAVDLVGVHPKEADLLKIEANPDLYEEYVDQWMADPRFPERVEEVWNQRFLMRTGETYFDLTEVGLGGVDEAVMGDVIAEEPLRLVRHILENDLSYAEIATADYTMANPLLAQMWSIDIGDDATGWVEGQYTDGRPHAGILTMTTTWQRNPSMGGNANRHRANAISKMLLCDDYLSRPIVLSRAAVDQLTLDPEDAINSNIGCQSCHSTLDPLAANFFGFFTYDDNMGIDQTIYRPENEENWKFYANKEPGYYGRPTANIDEFAREITQDGRFVDCAVRTAFEGFTQRDITDADWEEIRPHTEAFVDSGLNLKALIRSIVLSEGYRAGRADDRELDDRLAGVKTASPAQLQAIVDDLTGYKWEFSGRDGLVTNDLGLQVLAGGIDSAFVTRRNYDPSVGMAFVHERLAQAAGYAVAEHDLAADRTEPTRLLHYVTLTDTPEANREAFEQQIRALYLQITGEPLVDDALEPAELIALWKYIWSVEGSATTAWGGVVSAVLRDPRVLTY